MCQSMEFTVSPSNLQNNSPITIHSINVTITYTVIEN